MNDFLKYVAGDLIKRFDDLSDVAVVFPNKRASLFLNSYLSEMSPRPIWSPHYITISDLFRFHSKMVTADRIPLIFDLFGCYKKHIASDETIDSFYNWGEIMLADFDDIDKNMADADAVFSLIRDYGEMENLDYLSEKQKAELNNYFGNNKVNSRLKENFNKVYEHLAEIYHDYKGILRDKGCTYEGALYREVAENLDNINFGHKKYIFVGFNMLQKVEEKLFEHLAKQDKALFYWDFDKFYTSSANGTALEAGHYIAHNLAKFPNALDSCSDEIYNNLNNKLHPKDIDIISATTENAQAHYMTQWLDDKKIKDGRKTAVVMCDEMILQEAVHCLPDNEALKVNITTGYPLQQTPVASLVQQLISLYTEGFDTGRNVYLTRYVVRVLNHPFVSVLCEKSDEIVSEFRLQGRLCTSVESLTVYGDMMEIIFTPVNYDAVEVSTDITRRISSVIRYIASHFKDENPLYTESIFRMYTLLQVFGDTLSSYADMKISISTYRKLAKQVISMTSIPFHGEPIDGIQMMGVLETRNIDFDNILLLSCNEGKVPKGITDTSFIPYTIRKGFGLTTVDHKVDIYAYYFYRLMQRAGHVSILYNASTEGTHKNEMSRFVLQTIVEQCHKFHFLSLDSAVKTYDKEPVEKVKNENVMKKLNAIKKISPSALNVYLNCELKYYYQYIADIKEPEVIMSENDIDYRIFGNLFHTAAENLYKDEHLVTEDIIKSKLNEKNYIDRVVSNSFKKNIFKNSDTIKLSDLNGLQRVIYNVIRKYIKDLLKADMKRAPFEVISTEREFSTDIDVNGRSIIISGTADRIDTKGDVTYIVDYKTGKEQSSDISSIDDLFDRTMDKKYDYYLQTILYCIIQSKKSKNKISPVLLHTNVLGKYDSYPVLKINKVPVEITDSCDDNEIFMERLKGKLAEMLSPDVSFKPSLNKKTCGYCPFYNLCYGKDFENIEYN